jgi:hypothetical protein
VVPSVTTVKPVVRVFSEHLFSEQEVIVMRVVERAVSVDGTTGVKVWHLLSEQEVMVTEEVEISVSVLVDSPSEVVVGVVVGAVLVVGVVVGVVVVSPLGLEEVAVTVIVKSWSALFSMSCGRPPQLTTNVAT